MFETKRTRNIVIILLGIVLVLIGVIFYLYKEVLVIKKIDNEQKSEVSDIVTKVSRLTILPVDEEPTIATVTNLDRLKGQAFFANAQIGDKVLIYQSSRKAILYNPTTDKIIEISSINLDNPSSVSENTSTTTNKNN